MDIFAVLVVLDIIIMLWRKVIYTHNSKGITFSQLSRNSSFRKHHNIYFKKFQIRNMKTLHICTVADLCYTVPYRSVIT